MKTCFTLPLALLAVLLLQCLAIPLPASNNDLPYQRLASSASSASVPSRPLDPKQALKGHSKFISEGSKLVRQVGQDHMKAMDHAIDLRNNNRPVYHASEYKHSVYSNEDYRNQVKKIREYHHVVPAMIEQANNHLISLESTGEEAKKREAVELHRALVEANEWINYLPQDPGAAEELRRMGTSVTMPLPGVRDTHDLTQYKKRVQSTLNELPVKKGKGWLHF